ncbi:Rib/alpha-like domain-containing protein [Actinotignum urinale]|uniref:Rib/alpha-like domain-containing protein n=1 Tax=Actinotignum urinale TaxID=190146 RepID=UPI002542ACF4|nr:Rib/alpha-like domain-containing protein [Actinotignum urinale]WIK58616.1 Rib/alpha-like domain-containing protein [Actinotignum urinale]
MWRRAQKAIVSSGVALAMLMTGTGSAFATMSTTHARYGGNPAVKPAPAGVRSAQPDQNDPKWTVDENGNVDADAIASGLITTGDWFSDAQIKANDVISGRIVIREPVPDASLSAIYDGFSGLESKQPVHIYLQWIDADGAVSPIYKTEAHDMKLGAKGTNGPGIYAFKLPIWTDANGKEHRFLTLATQKYRIWSEPGVNSTDNNKIVPFRTAPGQVPYVFDTGSGSGLGEFPGAVGTNGNMQKTGVWMHEFDSDNVLKAQTVTEDKLGPTKYAAGANYDPNYFKTISGVVWHERGNLRQLITNIEDSIGDVTAGGYKVFATVLTPDGARANAEIQKLPASLWAKKTKEMLQQHPEYIRGTWSAVVQNNTGAYTIRIPNNITDGYGGAKWWNNMYMWVEDPEGNRIPMMSTYNQPVFVKPDQGGFWAPQAKPEFNGAGLINRPYETWYNVNFALTPNREARIDITNFNTTDKPATPGDKAVAVINGDFTPVKKEVVWRGPSGEELKRCTVELTSNLKECKNFTVPDDAKPGSIYQVQLLSNGQPISSDSFIVMNLPKLGEVPEVKGKAGEAITPIYVPVLKSDLGQDFKCSLEGVPEGLVTTYVEGKGCEISGTPKNPTLDENGNVVAKDFKVKLEFKPKGKPDAQPLFSESAGKATIEKAADADGDGVPDVTDKCPGTAEGEKVDENGCSLNQLNDPKYEDTSVEQGKEATVPAPTFDNPTTPEVEKNKAPEGTTFEKTADTPDWAVVNPDGSITVKPGTGVDPKDYNVPVKVTYPNNGGSEVVNAKVTVTKAADADGDGVPDVTDKCPGTAEGEKVDENGCSLNQLNDPKYEDTSVEQGKEATVPAPTFDNPTTPEVEKNKAPEGTTFEKTADTPDWAVVNPDGSITVKPGTGVDPKDYNVPVKVTYPNNGGSEVVNAKVTVTKAADADGDGVPDVTDKCPGTAEGEKVDENGCSLNQLNDPKYEDTSVEQGKEATVPAPTFDNPTTPEVEKNKAPEGTTFEKTADTPDWAVVNPDGSITVKPGTGVDPKDYNVPVKVTYPNNGGSEVVNAKVTVTKAADADGDGVPDVTDKCPGTAEGEKVDENGCSLNQLNDPKYEDTSVEQGKEATVPAPTFDNPTTPEVEKNKAPEGTTFEKTADTPDWAVVNPDGSITVKPGTGVDPKDYNVPVKVTYPNNGGSEVVNAKVTVTKAADADGDGVPDVTDKCPGTAEGEKVDENGCSLNQLNDPKYEDTSVEQGKEATVPAPTFDNPTTPEVEKNKAPEGTTFEKTADTPDWAVVNPDGSITVKPGTGVDPKDYNVPVKVTYPNNGGSEVVNAKVTVTKAADADGDGVPDVTDKCPGTAEGEKVDENGCSLNQLNDPKYEDTSVEQGKEATVPAPTFDNPTTPEVEKNKAPEGTTFEKTADTPDWAVVNPDGSITVKPGTGVDPKDYNVPVKVTYPNNGGSEVVNAKVTVTKAASPKWDDAEGTPGAEVVVPNTGGKVPEGTTTDVTGPGKAKIDDKGNIVVNIDKDAKPGDKIVVTVKDKDDNVIDTVTVTVKQPATPAPNWDDGSGKPGAEVVVPNTGGKVPEGTTTDVTGPGKAKIDDKGNIVVDIDKDAKPGDKIVVTVKDKDGNVIDTATVTVTKGQSGSTGKKTSGKLVVTGVNVSGAITVGGILLLVGVAIVIARRKKNK